MLRGREESSWLRAALTSSFPHPTFPKSEENHPREPRCEPTEGRRKPQP